MSGIPLERFIRIHNRVLVFLVGTLSVTVILKIGSIQYLELIFAMDLFVLLWFFLKKDLQVRVFRPFASLAGSYAIFLAAAFLLALIALRQNFNTTGISLLQRPVAITLSRMAELFLDVFYALYLASLFREDERLCAFGAKVYYWMGVAGGLYSIVSYPLNYYFNLQLGTYNDEHRFRGFDNEGGPYGVYLLSLFALCIVMRWKGWLSNKQFYGGLLLFFICLVGSQSKAAFFGVAILGILYLMWTLRGGKRLAMVGAIAAALVMLALALDLPEKLELYAEVVAAYTQFSNLHAEDPNLVQGRVAGTVLAPRMIEAHPLLGIGWGNYPLVRDNPQYRRGSAFAITLADAPSLGPVDYMVDLGIPLWIYLTWINLKPLYLLRRRNADGRVLALTAMQPIAVLCGTHLNITYPWVTLALAMGIGFGAGRQDTTA